MTKLMIKLWTWLTHPASGLTIVAVLWLGVFLANSTAGVGIKFIVAVVVVLALPWVTERCLKLQDYPFESRFSYRNLPARRAAARVIRAVSEVWAILLIAQGGHDWYVLGFAVVIFFAAAIELRLDNILESQPAES